MRTRTRGTGATPVVTEGWYKPFSGAQFSMGTAEYDFSETGEMIRDDPRRKWVRTRRGGTRLAFKPCQHVSYTCAEPAFGWLFTGPNVVTNKDQVYLTPCLWPVQSNPIHPFTGRKWNFTEYVLELVDTSLDKSVYYDHWQAAKPSLTTRAGLSVFLYELRDIKRMFSILPDKHFKLSDWREVFRYANGQHLNYNFGWKPFISDVQRTFSALSSFESRLNNFMVAQGKSLTRSRTTETSRTVSKTQDTRDPILDNQNSFWKWYYQYTATVYQHSGFQFSYEVPEYSPRELRTRALLDSLGLNINVSTIWQVIPWSFVVDWFYDVEGLLKTNEEDWITPWIYWDQSYSSTKVVSEGEWWLENTRGSIHPGITWSAKHYTRSVGLSPEFSGETDSFSADKIRLGGSLIIGRLL